MFISVVNKACLNLRERERLIPIKERETNTDKGEREREIYFNRLLKSISYSYIVLLNCLNIEAESRV